MKQTQLSKEMYANVDWIMACIANKEGPTKIALRFNKLKKRRRTPACSAESMGQFIVLEKERRARAPKGFNQLLVSAWTKQGLQELQAA